MPLSIVRFGFRQWITLDKVAESAPDFAGSARAGDESSLDDWQLPPTPSSPSTCLQLDAREFIASSTLMEGSKRADVWQSDSESPAGELSSVVATEQLDPFILRFTANTAPQALLLQHHAQRAPFLRPMSQLDSILDCHAGASPRTPTKADHSMAPIARARVAPYGAPAHILSVPVAYLDAMEEEALDAWSALFGYTRELLVGPASKQHTQEQPRVSNLVWISMEGNDDPMLYPQRLVFIDEKETAAMYTAQPTDDEAATVTIEHGVAKRAIELESEQMPQTDDAAMRIDHIEPSDEREEGEDEGEEGEYDEEGEIADPVEPAELAEPIEQNTLPASVELDSAIANLVPLSSQPLEKSLAAIQESIAQFQAELQAEEEEEARRRKLLARESASKDTKPTAKGARAGTANGTRKRQRSNARDEKPTKARRKSDAGAKDTRSESSNDDIPLQALVGCSAAPPLPVATQASVDGVESGIDGLFGDSQADGPAADAQGDMGLGFGQMGDDMGLGMDMGMGDNLGDFATNMFGVTDDDFNFFDSVPAQQLKAEAPAAIPQPAIEADAMDIDLKHEAMFGDAVNSQSADALVSADANQSMDDMFDDDNMFDSFFGGPATSADASLVNTNGVTLANVDGVSLASVDAGAQSSGTQFLVSSSSHADAISVAGSMAPFKPEDVKPTLMHTLSSPPGIASALSATETHVGSVEPLPSTMDMDLATPASIKMTPAPSTDILTPTPSANIVALPKSGPVAEDHADALPTVCPAEASSVIQPQLQPRAGLGVSATTASSLAVLSAEPTSRKPSINAPKPKNPATTPKPYTSISTPFDDIGTSTRSWLRSWPTPMHISDDSGDLDPLSIQHASLMEKSLNPVAWIKRISARKLQHQARVQKRTGVTTRVIPQSVRRLRGWLTAYKAKLSYTRDFAPPGVRNSAREHDIIQVGAAADARGADTNEALDGLDMQPSGGNGVDAGKALTASDLQYPVGGHARERDGHLPTFMSIINPRTSSQLTGSHYVQMPGALPLSLDIGNLHMAAASAMLSPAPALSPTASADSRAVVSTQAISASWVPVWMRMTGSVAELLISASSLDGATWAAVYSVLGPSTRQSLQTKEDTYLADIPLLRPATAQSAPAQLVSRPAAGNLGARIGGLLMLGGPGGKAQAQLEHPILADNAPDTTCAASKCVSELRMGSGNWTGIVEMLCDWAVHSTLLACAQQDAGHNSGTGEGQSGHAMEARNALPWSAVSSALLSFWDSDRISSQVSASDDGEQSLARGPLSLARLVSLDNATPSPTSKYRGYVVKKKRSAHQALNSSSISSNSNSNVSISSEGSLVVPSGVGTIEPLLDVRVLVGTYGQQDVSVDADGAALLRRRDAESIYIKRWRYTQKLATRATHDARVAAGEIEEAEEGEEREDGDAAEENKLDVEDWPDPDCFAMEPEDALRRVCVAASPVALRWWPQMHMRPVGASKDVRWCAFVPPHLGSDSAAIDDASSEDGGIAHAPGAAEWCQRSHARTVRYLAGVDSAYQASHLGTHRALALGSTLDGVFTQTAECAQPLAPHEPWSARLRFDAQRLGHCMAHGWYAASQLEQQRQGDGTALASASTIVLYMLVPRPHALELWLALADAACIATQFFESTLSSLIARTAHGVPSSTTGVCSNVKWPALLVHPLPLDMLAPQGARVLRVPSPQETALCVYNRCPEFLAHAPSAAAPVQPARGEWQPPALDFLASATPPAAPKSASAPQALVRHASYHVHSARPANSAFAHRAFIISMPAVFPLAQSALAAAAMPVSVARARTDTLLDLESANIRADSMHEHIDACELAEVQVRIDPAPTDRLCAKLAAHPLRPGDHTGTLHCVYSTTWVGAQRWLAVCFCDDHGEYVEHDV
ncbi:hypothetical protein GGF43_002336, partial [Coemansia sp. RSA 2618]